MNEISFKSTFRIPISQPGVNAAKKARLRELIQSYPNGLIGKGKLGNARVSVADSEDANFIQKLKNIGYKIYQKFEGENIPAENLDAYIKTRLEGRDYSQKGKNMPRMSRETREKHRTGRNFVALRKEAAEEVFSKPEAPLLKEGSEEFNPIFEKPKGSPERIRKTKDYLECKEEFGEAFAEALFFGIK